MALGVFRENNAARNFYPCALSSTEASFVSWEGWGGKKSTRDVPTRLLLFDHGYPAGTSAEESSRYHKRGLEMIWNKRRTLFIQVRIDLVARLIITLTLKSEGEIPWCYRSNQTSLVKRLYSTTYFLQFRKQKFEDYFHVNFFRPLLGLLGVRGLKF